MYSLKLLQFSSLNPPQKEVIERMVDFIQFWSVQKTQLVHHAPLSIFNIRFWNSHTLWNSLKLVHHAPLWNSHTRNYSPYSLKSNLSHIIWILDEEVMIVLPGTPVYWLASGLVKNPIFHIVYLHIYSESRDEFFTTIPWYVFSIP